MTRRASDLFAEAVEAAIDRHGEGEEIRWDCSLAPNDQGGISLVLVVWLPSGTVGQHLIGSAAFHTPPPVLFPEEVDATVAAFLRDLRAQRTKDLTVATNGAQGPSAGRSGLILP